MSDSRNIEILTKCLEIDEKAHEIYKKFSALARSRELADFWARMSNEEQTHCKYWKKLIALAKKDLLPGPADHGHDLGEEMEEMGDRINQLVLKSEKEMDDTAMMLIASRLEFYLMHPAILHFINFLESFPEQDSPITNYRNHIDNFLKVLGKFGRDNPELELLAEVLYRLWKDNAKMELMSNTDDLTGILNRRGLFEAFHPLIYLARRKMQGIGVMVIDVDDFKMINDQYGHKAGDDALVWLAGLLKTNLRNSDLLGRYGGDEFFVFLSDVDLNYLFSVALKLRKLVEMESKSRKPFTISIGVTGGILGADIDGGLQAMIRKADENLYKAKKAGKNCVIIDAEILE